MSQSKLVLVPPRLGGRTLRSTSSRSRGCCFEARLDRRARRDDTFVLLVLLVLELVRGGVRGGGEHGDGEQQQHPLAGAAGA